MIKHILGIAAFGDQPEQDITDTEYDELKSAKAILKNALEAEEKYEILIANYVDFEKEVLSLSADRMIRARWEYIDFFDLSLSLNIKMVNLLTSARLYIDQVGSNARKAVFVSDVNLKELIKSWFSSEYDANKNYRFMEALRNHVQHKGLPIHNYGVRSGWTDHVDEGGVHEYTLDVSALKESLKKDNKIPRKVLDEIDDKVDLIDTVRSYLESLSNVHSQIRDFIEESVLVSRTMIEDVRSKYRELHPSQKLIGFSAMKWQKNIMIDSFSLLLDWDDIRLLLIRRNRPLVKLDKRHVTNRRN